MIKKLILVLLNIVIPFYKDYKNCLIYAKINDLSYISYVKFRLGISKNYCFFPSNCIVGNSRRIYIGKNSVIGRQFSYFNGSGGIYIGNYVRCAPNVALLSGNHDLYDHRKTIGKPIKIGDYSWIGFGARVMAGVELGPRTIVAANAVVTKSFPEGYCVLAGVPAKKIKELVPEEVVKYVAEKEYYGMIPASKFNKYANKYLDIEYLKKVFPEEFSSIS